MLHFAAASRGSPPVQTAHLDPLRSGPTILPRFSAVLHGGADAAHALLAAAGPGTRVVRVGNPLRAPLTIERILIQSGQMEAGLLTDDAADQAMHRLCHRRDGEARVLLAIDQAETLSPAALRSLVRIAAPSGPPRPPQGSVQADLHVVFIGTPAFATLLAAPGLEPLRDALSHLDAQPGDAPTPDPSPPPAAPVVPDPAAGQLVLAATPAPPAAPYLDPPQPAHLPDRAAPMQAAPVQPLAPMPVATQPPAPARHPAMTEAVMPPVAAKPVPAPANPSKHLAMMANVMPVRTRPEGAAPLPVPDAAAKSGLPVAAMPSIPPAARRGRSRTLAALVVLAVLGALAFVVATRPDVQATLGIQDLVTQVREAARHFGM